MQQAPTWILEITFQDECLNTSLFEKEQTLPLKTISSTPVYLSKIKQLTNEIISVINRTNQEKIVDDNAIEELKKNGRILYDFLFSRQVKDQLSSLNSINLILSLDEKLINIPWELLFDGDNFLCLKFNLGRSIRTQTYQMRPQYRSITVNPRMLILANPTGDLKSAYQEGLYIKNRLSKRGKISIDFKAQEIDSNYIHKNLRDYDIIHFAGHCEYNNKKPEESGWVMSDGWLSAKDLFALGGNATLPSIIFANACQSARITNNLLDFQTQINVYGLAQAFLFAGVRHYLGSFWRIEDNSSGEFAEEFYDQITTGCSIGQAVRLARLKLFRKYGTSVVAWAGYVLYGDPSFILLPSSYKDREATKKKVGFHISDSFRKKIFTFSFVLMAIILTFAFTKILSRFRPNSIILLSRAEYFYDRGKNMKVIDLLREITQKDPLFLPAWRLRGDVNFRIGRFSEAISDYFDYARFSERKRDFKHLAAAYIKIAWTYHMWGDYKKSKEFYQKALDLSKEHQDKLNEADAIARLAVWHIDKGNNEAAFSLLMKSLEINQQRARNPEHRFNLACDYFNIAFLYVEKDDYATAKEFFKKSNDIFESLGEIQELSDYYFDMGEIALFEKNYDLALEFYNKGLSLDRRLGHRFNLSSDYWMLGEFYWEIGKLAEAENYFKEAIFICREIDNTPVLAGVYYDLGLMYKEKGEKEKAKEYLSLSLELYREIDTPDYQQVQQDYLALE